MKNLNLSINQKGNDFYLKWKKDTNQGAFIYAPAMLMFYLGIGVLIYGTGFKFYLISIYPVLLICLGFIYPIFSRKKYLNRMVETIEQKGDVIIIQTYKWFNAEAVCEVSKINAAQLTKYKEQAFFKGKEVYILKFKDSKANEFYIVEEFFDPIKDFLVLFKQ